MCELKLDFEKNRNDPIFSCNDISYGFNIEDDENYKRFTTKTWLFKNFNTDKYWMDVDGIPVPFLFNNKIYTPGVRGDALYIIRLIKLQSPILNEVLLEIARSIAMQGNFLSKEVKDQLMDTINGYLDKTQTDGNDFLNRGPHIRLTYIIPKDEIPDSGILEMNYFKIANYAPALYEQLESCGVPVADAEPYADPEPIIKSTGIYNKLKVELSIHTKQDDVFNVTIGHEVFTLEPNVSKFVTNDHMQIAVDDGRLYKYPIDSKRFNDFGIFKIGEDKDESVLDNYKIELLKTLNDQTSNKMAVGKFVAEHNVALQKVLSGMIKNETAVTAKDKEATGLVKELLKLMTAL